MFVESKIVKRIYADKKMNFCFRYKISWTEIRKFPRHGNVENRARAMKMPKMGSCTLKEDTENMYKVSGIATSAVTVFVVAPDIWEHVERDIGHTHTMRSHQER